MCKKKLIEVMLSHPGTLPDLKLVQTLRLTDWYIAAGYVRNRVWDYLHNIKEPLILDDVDIIYFDRSDIAEETDKKYEAQLKSINSHMNWSVKNQARMHLRNHHDPYSSISDATKRWPETATAVGITLTDQGAVEVIAPHGLEDLFALRIRQSPYFRDRALFMKRIHDKRWLDRWKQLLWDGR